MNIVKALSITALASTMLFTATACGSGGTSGPEAAPTVQSEEVVVDSKSEIVSTVDRYYEVVSDEEGLQPMLDATDTLTKEMSDEEAKGIIAASAPEIFALFDLEDEDSVPNAYAFILTGAMVGSMGEEVEFSASEDAVTIDGDTAKYDGTQTVVFVDGEQQPLVEDEPTEDNYINLVKKDGTWLIVPPATM